jgi:hypothetical protein
MTALRLKATLIGLEDLDRKTPTRQRRDNADRAAARYEDGTLGRHFPAFYAGAASLQYLSLCAMNDKAPQQMPHQRAENPKAALSR